MKIRYGLIVLGGLLLALGLLAPAFAAQGGEGNNTDCNGQGNPNSPCTGQGGAGGAGGDASAAAAASATSTAVSVSEASAHQKQKQQQQQGQLQGQGQQQKTEVTIQGDRTENPAQAPAIFSPNLTSSPEACMGSISGGAGIGFQGISAGFNLGSTWTNQECQDRMNARTLGSLGQNQAALEYLAASNPKIAEALKKAGVKLASVDISVPALTLNTPLGQTPVVQPGGVKIEKRDEVAKADGPTCGDGKPAKLRGVFYSCYGWDR